MAENQRPYQDFPPATSPYWPDDGWEQVAKIIRERRHELGLTQEQAAEKAGTVSVATWRILESSRDPKHRFSIRTLAGVARALDWGPSWAHDAAHGRWPEVQTHHGRRPNLTEEQIAQLDVQSDAVDFVLDKFVHLSESNRRYVEGVVDGLLHQQTDEED